MNVTWPSYFDKETSLPSMSKALNSKIDLADLESGFSAMVLFEAEKRQQEVCRFLLEMKADLDLSKGCICFAFMCSAKFTEFDIHCTIGQRLLFIFEE